MSKVNRRFDRTVRTTRLNAANTRLRYASVVVHQSIPESFPVPPITYAAHSDTVSEAPGTFANGAKQAKRDNYEIVSATDASKILPTFAEADQLARIAAWPAIKLAAEQAAITAAQELLAYQERTALELEQEEAESNEMVSNLLASIFG